MSCFTMCVWGFYQVNRLASKCLYPLNHFRVLDYTFVCFPSLPEIQLSSTAPMNRNNKTSSDSKHLYWGTEDLSLKPSSPLNQVFRSHCQNEAPTPGILLVICLFAHFFPFIFACSFIFTFSVCMCVYVCTYIPANVPAINICIK